MMVSLAPVPMATWGNHEQSHVGQNYLRSLFALGFQGFLIPDLRGDLCCSAPECCQYPGMPSTRSGASWGIPFCSASRCSRLALSPEAFWAHTKRWNYWQLIFPCRAISAKVKTKVAFNLTARQLVCFGAAAVVGVPLFFVLRDTAGNSGATLGMMAVMLPMHFFGHVPEKRSARRKDPAVLCSGAFCSPEGASVQNPQLLCTSYEGR